MVNIESVPSEAGPDLDGIEQGISNNEVEIVTLGCALLAMTHWYWVVRMANSTAVAAMAKR